MPACLCNTRAWNSRDSRTQKTDQFECTSVEIADGREGRERLANVKERTGQFRAGLDALGLESIPGPHPVVPLLVRDTGRARRMVRGLFERGVLAVGLTFPVVPRGDETIRFQINAAHTRADIDEVLAAIEAEK